MEELKFNKTNIAFRSVTGTVLNSTKLIETHFSSYDPGISSKAVTNHEFWIEKDDGTELSVRLKGIEIPLRQGQKITLISCRKKSKKPDSPWWYTSLINHSEKSIRTINDAKGLNKLMNVELVFLSAIIYAIISYVIAVLLAFSLGFMGFSTKESEPLMIAAITIPFSYLLAKKIIRKIRFEKNLANHIRKISQSTL